MFYYISIQVLPVKFHHVFLKILMWSLPYVASVAERHLSYSILPYSFWLSSYHRRHSRIHCCLATTIWSAAHVKLYSAIINWAPIIAFSSYFAATIYHHLIFQAIIVKLPLICIIVWCHIHRAEVCWGQTDGQLAQKVISVSWHKFMQLILFVLLHSVSSQIFITYLTLQ